MIYCNKCGQELSEDSLFCSKCGNKLQVDSTDQNEDSQKVEQIDIKPDNVKAKGKNFLKNKIFIYFLGSVAIILLVTSLIYFNLPQVKAKMVVNNYLEAIKNGEDTYDYKDSEVDDFINVLNYKFLNVKKVNEKPEIFEIDQELWESAYKDEFPTFARLREEYINVFTEGGKYRDRVISDTSYLLVLKTGEFYKEYVLLYDVEVTNGLGQKVYKKVEFYVDNEDDEFLVKDYTY